MLLIDRNVLEIANSLCRLQAETGREHLRAIATDGAIYSASGEIDRVYPPSDLLARFAEVDAEIVYHHSHPDDRALSPSDLSLIAQPGVKAIWAHAPSGASYGAQLQEGLAKDSYRAALDQLNGHLLLEIVQRGGVLLGETSFEAFRDFATMLALEKQGWIHCHLAWSDQTRREIFDEASGFYTLVNFLNSVTLPV